MQFVLGAEFARDRRESPETRAAAAFPGFRTIPKATSI
jgi:hypothetical protein